ncbi:MAG: AmmeMemoRadiSam system radical SAM enzyme [Syntrophales bacterium]|jgi:pyruvate formate lyase activating enzyme|nr:AmmeMemoRadiSam system radical SAM enzyme [Syntrophales bacterium]MDY0044059.1 AmmeMemoRadiSam system radical SAM enzyme [Syntrophales bacterium]
MELREAMFYEKTSKGNLHCFLCSHHCRIPESQFGICSVRQNLEGKLITHSYGKVISAGVDPIEKKPLYHFFPGSLSYSIATAGCNFKCDFCQNWQISQITKENSLDRMFHEMPPEKVVENAKEGHCQSISYTYTEPTIFFEYAFDISRIAKKSGLYNVFVTNGFMTPEALQTIRPYLDAANVDLKAFNENFYKKVCHGHLKPVLDSIRLMKELGIWVEITTLIIPGENDSEDEMRSIARFIAETDSSIPWHISRFHPDYHYMDRETTSVLTLDRASTIGKEEGLNFIYIGNVGNATYTVCQFCGEPLIERDVFTVKNNRIDNSSCPRCGAPVPGLFNIQGYQK